MNLLAVCMVSLFFITLVGKRASESVDKVVQLKVLTTDNVLRTDMIQK